MAPANATDDETLLDVVGELVEAGERDLLDGGIRAERVADEVPISTSRLQERLAALASEGKLVRVWGAGPDSYDARLSYLPADHPDAEEPEY